MRAKNQGCEHVLASHGFLLRVFAASVGPIEAFAAELWPKLFTRTVFRRELAAQRRRDRQQVKQPSFASFTEATTCY